MKNISHILLLSTIDFCVVSDLGNSADVDFDIAFLKAVIGETEMIEILKTSLLQGFFGTVKGTAVDSQNRSCRLG